MAWVRPEFFIDFLVEKAQVSKSLVDNDRIP
jgi:hypothetical protein